MRTGWMLLSVLLLSACATSPAERSARMQAEVDEMIQVYGPACERLGYAKDSERWRDCVLNLANKDEVRRYAARPLTTSCFGHRGFFQCTQF